MDSRSSDTAGCPDEARALLARSKRTNGWTACLRPCALLLCVFVPACLEFPGWQDATGAEGEGESEGEGEGEGEGPAPTVRLVGGVVTAAAVESADGRYRVRQGFVAGPARVCSEAQVCVTGGIQP